MFSFLVVLQVRGTTTNASYIFPVLYTHSLAVTLLTDGFC